MSRWQPKEHPDHLVEFNDKDGAIPNINGRVIKGKLTIRKLIGDMIDGNTELNAIRKAQARTKYRI